MFGISLGSMLRRAIDGGSAPLPVVRTTASSIFSRDAVNRRGVMTEVSRSKYKPHIGAKEAARYAGKATLGHNASRVLA